MTDNLIKSEQHTRTKNPLSDPLHYKVSPLVFGFGDWKPLLLDRLSTKNYKPRATGSLRHLMLKVFCAILKTAPYRLNYSMSN